METSVPGALRMELVSDQWSPADGVAEQAFDQLVFLNPGVCRYPTAMIY